MFNWICCLEKTNKILAIIKRNNSGGLLRDTMIILSGSTGAQVLAFLLTPIITRMFTAGNFGIMTTFSTIALTLAVFGNGSYDQAIILPKEDRKAWNLFCLCLVIATLFFGMICLVTYLFEKSITQLIFGTIHNGLVYLLPLTVFVQCLSMSMRVWTLRMNGYKALSSTAFIGVAGNQGTKILGGWSLGDKLSPLIAGSFLQAFIPCFFLGANMCHKTPKHLFRWPCKAELFNVMLEYKKFPLYATWVEFLINLGRSVTIILLAAIYDSKIVGIYGLVFNVLRLPVFVIGDSIRYSCMPRFASLINNKMPLRGLFVKIILSLAAISAVPLALIMAFGPQLFTLVFGQNWGEAGVYARILSPWLLMTIFLPVAAAILVITQRQQFRLGFNFALSGFQVATMIIAKIYQLDIYTLLTVLSIGCALFYLYKIIYTFHLIEAYEKTAQQNL